MRRRTMFLVLFFICLSVALAAEQTVCLNMIVKNETKVIERCLNSAKPLIDYWVIVDTGSTDGTQEMIKTLMKDIPGELHERPWKNFEHNRNEAMDLAMDKGDYLLFIDADEEFVYEPSYTFPELKDDCYFFEIHYSGMRYHRPLLITSDIPWRWKGVVHESLYCEEMETTSTMAGIYDLVHTDGFRSHDPEKYKKDAAILEASLKDDPGNTRTQFYLAQSYRDAGENTLALQHYDKRVAMGGWKEEVFWSQLQTGLLAETLKLPKKEILARYKKAHDLLPYRVEPLYYMALYYRGNEEWEHAYDAAKRGLGLPITLRNNNLFLEEWIYDWGLLLEYSIAAYWTNRFHESFLATQLLLSSPNLPDNVKEQAKKNLAFINDKLVILQVTDHMVINVEEPKIAEESEIR